MFELRCTVRKCPHILQQRETGLHCENGHHFDRAKEGYWNLLQPQDRRSDQPGDAVEAVLARRRWLDRGYMASLIEQLNDWTEPEVIPRSGRPRVMDLGCGEGTFGAALFPPETFDFCGVDLSKRAIKLAARRHPDSTWVLANADRFLPASDQSVDLVMSLFGRRPTEEIQRVLSGEGRVMVAVPGEDDLIELREHVQKAGHRRRRGDTIIEAFASVGLECLRQASWNHRVRLQSDAIQDAMAMTYRGARISQRDRLASLDEMEVTLSADLFLFGRSDVQATSATAADSAGNSEGTKL